MPPPRPSMAVGSTWGFPAFAEGRPPVGAGCSVAVFPVFEAFVGTKKATETLSGCGGFILPESVLLLLHLRNIGTAAVRHFRRHADRFAERRVRVDGLADIDRVAAHLDGQTHLADHVAGAWADDGAADHAVPTVFRGVEDQLGEAVLGAVGDGAAGGGPRDLLSMASLNSNIKWQFSGRGNFRLGRGFVVQYDRYLSCCETSATNGQPGLLCNMPSGKMSEWI